MLPAVPTSKLYDPDEIFVGVNVNCFDPMESPSVVAPEIALTQEIAVKCCGRKPGIGLFALMLVTVIGMLDRTESATAVRTICPPPSP